MRKKLLLNFAALFICLMIVVSEVSGDYDELAPKCCSDTPANTLVARQCANGKKINLNCTLKYVLDPEFEGDQFRIDRNGHLISNDDANVLIENFCLTRFNESNHTIAIVCADDGDEHLLKDVRFYNLRASCGFVSVVFIVATVAVYWMVPSLRDLQGKCIMHSLTFLAISLMNLGIVQLNYLPTFWCTFYSFFNYYTFMTTFFWLNITSFHIWKTVVHPNILGTEKQWYFLYNFYGHGTPTLLLIMLMILEYVPGDHFKPQFGIATCWFKGLVETWTYFYGPLTFLLLVNLILFIWSVTMLYKNSNKTNDIKLNSLKFKVRLYMKLFFVMGLMWMFEVISAALDNVHVVLDYLWIMTDYVNVLQGVLIFLLLVVFRKRVRRGLANKHICGLNFPSAWKHLDDEETAVVIDDDDYVDEMNITTNTATM